MSLQALIDEQLLKKEKEHATRQRSGKFKPSSLGMCYRKQIFSKRDEPITNPFDIRHLRVFAVGNYFHDKIQSLIPDYKSEVTAESDMFYGRADVVTSDTVYDIKTVHSNSFWYAQKKEYDIKKEKRHNWLQLTCYASILNKDKICLVQISKDDLTIAENWDYTKNWLPELNKEIDQLKIYDVSEDLPPACPVFKTECEKYCSWFNRCKEVEHDGHREHPSEQSGKTSKSK